MITEYGFGKTITTSFEHAIDIVTDALQKEGFGVLTKIDVQATLKNKLDQDIAPYHILGACNPPLAHQALSEEPSIGLLLPCNVVIRQQDVDSVYVEFMDPKAVLSLVNNPAIHLLAKDVRERLDRVCKAL
jgi:uncharacterized protein (DUF302 family)